MLKKYWNKSKLHRVLITTGGIILALWVLGAIVASFSDYEPDKRSADPTPNPTAIAQVQEECNRYNDVYNSGREIGLTHAEIVKVIRDTLSPKVDGELSVEVVEIVLDLCGAFES